MIELLAASLISNLLIFIFGYLFCKYALSQNNLYVEDFAEVSLFGVIFLSFLALIINYFVPLNQIVGTALIAVGIIPGYLIIRNLKKKKKFFYFLLFTTFVTTLLIFASNINRPDAGLYHLPYASLVNESKIVIGSANIHFRFGHISIVQYLSAIYSNYLFPVSNIVTPLASIFSIFLFYSINKISEHLKNNSNEIAFVIFLIVIYSIYSFHRYSAYGNDMPSHIYFFLLVIVLLEVKKISTCSTKDFYKISFVCIFLLSLKSFLAIVAIIPLTIFIFSRKKNNLVFNINFIIAFVFLFSWLFKNLLSSGCIIYPLQASCFNNLLQSNFEQTRDAQLVSEAWSKGWIDQKNLVLPYDLYNQNFNWLKTWSDVHLKKIYEKFLPFVAFSILIVLGMVGGMKNSRRPLKRRGQLEQSFYLLIFFSVLFSTAWFLKFPVYRYGQSFLSILFILTFSFLFFKFLNKHSLPNYKKLYKIVIVTALILFCGKNIVRISHDGGKKYNNYPWPRIYSLNDKDKNFKQDFKLIKMQGEKLYYYSKGELCMYSSSPCSNYKLEHLRKKKIWNYSVYYFNKK